MNGADPHPRASAVMEIVDRLLLERGELDPVACLVELGFVKASDELGCRSPADVQAALLVSVTEATAALEQAQAYAGQQGMTVGAAPPSSGPRSASGASPRLVALCGRVLRPAAAEAQLDLFHDSALAVALHGLRTALLEQRAADAQAALGRVSALSADLHAVEDYGRLLRASARREAAPAERVCELDGAIGAIAARCLGTQAAEYLAPLWSEVAAALAGTPFVPTAPTLHASYAYARAARWGEVVHCIESETGWREHAALVMRLAEAHARLGSTEIARPLWAHLCWKHGSAASGVLRHAPGDPVLGRLFREFLAADPPLDVPDFPAWLLVADGQQRWLVPAEAAPDDAHGRAYAALEHVVSSDGEIGARVALHALRPDLLRLYLAARESRRL